MAQCTLFSSLHESFTKIHHIPGHKTHLHKFEWREIIQSLLSDHSEIKLEISSSKIPLHAYQNGQNPQHRQHQVLAGIQSNRNSHCWWQCKTVPPPWKTVEDSLVVSYETKHTVTIRPSSWAPCYLPKGIKNLRPHKILHIDVHSSFVDKTGIIKPPPERAVDGITGMMPSLTQQLASTAITAPHAGPGGPVGPG